LTPEKGPSEFIKVFFPEVLYHGAKKRQATPRICRYLLGFVNGRRKSDLVYASAWFGYLP
jgi:hypothetical protein